MKLDKNNLKYFYMIKFDIEILFLVVLAVIVIIVFLKKRRKMQVGVIGLGFVGLSLSVVYGSKKIPINAVDIDNEKILNLKKGKSPFFEPNLDTLLKKCIKSKTIEFYILIAVILIFITIATGGFMAGTNSGQSFNTFPLMNGKIIPDDYIIDDLGIYNIFENTVAINFNHRWLSIFVFFYILFV